MNRFRPAIEGNGFLSCECSSFSQSTFDVDFSTMTGRGGLVIGSTPDDAAHYYKLATDQNHIQSLDMYGKCLESGLGVPIDLNQAAACYKRSAMQGYSKTQYAYGYCLEFGKGILLNLITDVV